MMKILTQLVFLACLLYSGSATAGELPPTGLPGLVQIATEASVQSALEFGEDQKKAVAEAAELLSQVRDGKARAMARANLAAALSAKQLSRLEQIFWQRLGGSAIFEPKVSKALDLTTDQWDRLLDAKKVNVSENKKMRAFLALARFGSKEAMDAYKKTFRTAASERLMAVLTSSQRKQLDQMFGPPAGN